MYKHGLRVLTSEDYQDSFYDLGEFCKKHLSLVLYGQFGNPSFPSISDLDVLICLKDSQFSKERKQILNYIEQDSVRKYLFFHDPLIIPESILPDLTFMHTLYGLNLEYNVCNYIPKLQSEEHSNFLNLIWATFLISISPSFFIKGKRSDRDLLLLFKNICQSIDNFSDKYNALKVSSEARENYFNGSLNGADIQDLVANYYSILLDCLDIYDNFNIGGVVFKSRYLVSYNKIIKRNNVNGYRVKGKVISIYLNEKLFCLFESFYNGFSNDLVVSNYISTYKRLMNKFDSLDIDNPFVVPFAFQFYRRDLLFKCLKLVNSFRI
ncbi:hypothetical protein [Lunatimonas salinarum]|uniref:hypothetical protein n=1 Tax=Lunatimonas salinarum TaxID=1774590 RepID=UPI001ADFCAB1|nr:hypothetical protein [Lunatimonas salinarum]